MKAARFQVAQVDKDEEGEAAQVGPLLLHCSRVIYCEEGEAAQVGPLLVHCSRGIYCEEGEAAQVGPLLVHCCRGIYCEEGEAAQVGALLLHCSRGIYCALRSFCVPHPLLIFIFPGTLIDVILRHFAPFQIFFPNSNYIAFCIMYYPCIAVVSVHNSSVRRKLHNKRGKMHSWVINYKKDCRLIALLVLSILFTICLM